MSYQPPYTITPKITHLVAQISEAIGGYYAQENLRLHRVNRIQCATHSKPMNCSMYSIPIKSMIC